MYGRVPYVTEIGQRNGLGGSHVLPTTAGSSTPSVSRRDDADAVLRIGKIAGRLVVHGVDDDDRLVEAQQKREALTAAGHRPVFSALQGDLRALRFMMES